MFRRILPWQLLPLLTALFVLFWGTAALAQTTGEIVGTVTAASDGSELPGVTLTLGSPDGLLGGAQTRTTDESGRYQFGNLTPGRYEITASRERFKGITKTEILVVVGRKTDVSFAMEEGKESDKIVVETKAKTVDVDNVTRGEVLTKEFLEQIPTGRSYQSAVTQVAGVVDNGSGNPNMGGGAYNENTYMLDGINITDPVTGTFSANFNYDAIQQVQVLLGGYEPEYGISLGGIINLVTDSGNNNLQFDASAFYQNRGVAPRIDARYAHDGFRIAPTGFDSQFSILQINTKVSGPIVRDRAWFLFSYSGERSLIANAGVALPRDYDGQYILGKLAVQPTSEHRFSALVQMDPTSIDNTVQSSIYVRPEAQGRQYQGGFVAQGKWQWFLSPNATLETQAVMQKSFIEVNGVPCTHDTQIGYNPCQPDEQEGDVDWETPGRTGIGGAFDSVNYGYFYFDDRIRYQASSKLSLLGIQDPLNGTHDMKFGVEASQQVWDQLQGYSGNTLYYDLNQISYDPQSFINYYWLEITGPIKFRTTGQQFNVFAQDAWKPISNLTIKYGLRYDNTVYRNDVGEAVLDAGLLGPRLYVAWDPFGDQKTKIAGGYGRFNDTARFGVASFTSLSNYGSKLYLGEFFQGGEGQGFVNDAARMYDIGPRTNPNTALDNLRVPRQDELVLLLQRQLIEDVSVGSNFSYKMTRNLFEFDETNLIYDQDGSQIIGSRTGNQLINIFRLRTPNVTKRDYVQADFYLDKVNSRRWFGRMTYSYVQSIGNSSSALSGSFANDPQTQYNYGNLLATDVRHQVKGYGAWNLPTDPWKQTVAFSFVYNSGFMFERLYWNDFAQGYGIRIRDRGVWDRLPGWWTLNLHFSQDLDVKKGKLVLDLQAFNVFNNLQSQWINTYYVYQQDRMFVSYRQDPFLVQAGIRYHF